MLQVIKLRGLDISSPFIL